MWAIDQQGGVFARMGVSEELPVGTKWIKINSNGLIVKMNIKCNAVFNVFENFFV